MQTKEYRNIDKSEWARGPWDDEPDKMQWPDATTGLPCLVVRNGSGALCGYVGVPPGHPAHGMDYGALDVQVHGGLTFARGCADQSHAAWLRWRDHWLARKGEAARYPSGDAANALRDHAAELVSFDAWVRLAEASAVCHIPGEGEPDGVWWLGFDCSHCDDMTPAYVRHGLCSGGRYRSLAYVRAECADLARQLDAMA